MKGTSDVLFVPLRELRKERTQSSNFYAFQFQKRVTGQGP